MRYFDTSWSSCGAGRGVELGLPTNDRWGLVRMYRWFPSILTVVTIVRPEPLVRWLRGSVLTVGVSNDRTNADKLTSTPDRARRAQ
jgi:hypothetical protein